MGVIIALSSLEPLSVVRSETLAPVPRESAWDAQAAGHYLDQRATLWMARSRERQGLDSACVSCHTGMSYLLASPALTGRSLSEPAQEFFSDVTRRVMHWQTAKVWYDASRGPDKPKQSRGTESVMNALVLTQRDARLDDVLSPEARLALEHMWELQLEEGNWPWIHFGLAPWETDGSEYWGACLAAIASASANTFAAETLSPVSGKARLRKYLLSGLTPDQSLHNQLALLWTSSHWEGLLSVDEADQIAVRAAAAQNGDGGFRLMDLGRWPTPESFTPTRTSDGYATAYVSFVLQAHESEHLATTIDDARRWLLTNQKEDGRWETLSVNKDRTSEEAFTRLLSSDAATAFAVLALADRHNRGDPTEVAR